MQNRIILDISNYIFVADELQKVDAIFLPGGSNPEQPEYAAQLYHEGYAKWIIPSGGVSVKKEAWPGVRSKAEIYDGDYHSDCEFFTDVLLKNGVRTPLFDALSNGFPGCFIYSETGSLLQYYQGQLAFHRGWGESCFGRIGTLWKSICRRL